MKLLVGLGNPGEKYANTRHNVGFGLILFLKSQNQNFESKSFTVDKKFEAEILKTKELMLTMPQTFMNLSGRSVRAAADYFNIDPQDICIAHDDLDIEMGKYKLEFARGPKIHNGVNSVEEHLGTKDFWRVRIGVDNRTKEQRAQIKGREYVLMKMRAEEQKLLDETYDQIVNELVENGFIEDGTYPPEAHPRRTGGSAKG